LERRGRVMTSDSSEERYDTGERQTRADRCDSGGSICDEEVESVLKIMLEMNGTT
jgi:hypothetical protein